jgi:hypothetical protein
LSSSFPASNLRQVEHLIDNSKKVRPGAVHALQRLERLLGAEARCISHHHFGEADDCV